MLALIGNEILYDDNMNKVADMVVKDKNIKIKQYKHPPIMFQLGIDSFLKKEMLPIYYNQFYYSKVNRDNFEYKKLFLYQ
mgnify:CR=1 FL=1